MNPTQKADAARLYVGKIQIRIATREKAKLRVLMLHADRGFGCGQLQEIAVSELKKRNIDFAPVGAKLKTAGYSHNQKRYLKIYCTGDILVRIPLPPDANALEAQAEKACKTNTELCTEINFLNTLITPAAIRKFQAYAASLWVPKTKTEVITDATLNQLTEGFVQATRPKTCKF